MPYKNKEDKKANARFNYNKNKTVKTCGWEKCDNKLPTNRKKFCCDTCSDNYFAKKIRLEKQKARELITKERFCAYEKCGKEIPKGTHAQKKYCPGTDCAYRQNQLDQKRQRAEKKKSKGIVMDTCAHDNCDNKFEHHPRKKYCCEAHRKDQSQRNAQRKKQESISEYKRAKTIALIENGNSKEIYIPEEYRVERNEQKEAKHFKYEIKHFSAKWMEEAWNKVRHEYVKETEGQEMKQESLDTDL